MTASSARRTMSRRRQAPSRQTPAWAALAVAIGLLAQLILPLVALTPADIAPAASAQDEEAPPPDAGVAATDVTAPTVTGTDIAVTADPATGTAVVYYDGYVAATDDIEVATFSCDPPSGSAFAVGSSSVTCAASDAAGNQGTATFTVFVDPAPDTTAPVISVPADIAGVEAQGANGAAIGYPAVTASDTEDGQVIAACADEGGNSVALDGGTFPLGATTVTCTATDAAGNPGRGSFTVTVVDTTAPVITVPDDITTKATPQDNAADNDRVTGAVDYDVTAEDLVDGAVTADCLDDGNPVPPAAGGAAFRLGTTSISCTATDAAGNTADPATFAITVTPAGPPSIASDKADYGPGELVTLTGGNWHAGEVVTVDVNDDEGMSWRRTVEVTADADGRIANAFNLPTWFVANYRVTATGPLSGTATSTFTDSVKVTASVTPTSAPQGTSTSFSFTVNNTSTDGETFRWVQIERQQSWTLTGCQTSRLNWTAVLSTSFCTFSTTATGGNPIAAGSSGAFTVVATPNSSSFTWKVLISTNSNGSSNQSASEAFSGSLAANSTAANQAPVAVDDTATTAEDTATTLTQANLKGNDTDGNTPNAQLSVTAVSNGTNGVAVLNGNGTVTFTPAPNFTGTAGFDYTVSDGSLSDTGHVTVTVTAVNDAPVPADDTASTPEDTTLYIAQSTLTQNDSRGAPNESTQALTVSQVSNPVNGSVAIVLAGDPDAAGNVGKIRFVPTANYNGPASFAYKVCDNGTPQACSVGTATVSITVNAVNDAPVAISQSVSTNEDTAKAIVLSATDVDGNSLAYTVLATPTHGTLTGTAPNLTYTPASNYNGPDSFTFRANDGSLNSNTATVSITVAAVNDVPVAVDDTATTAEDTANTLTQANLKGNDADVDNTTAQLSVTAVSGATNGAAVLNGDGTVTFTPAANFNGTAGFDYRVCDNGAPQECSVGTATVTITITAVNDAPVAVDDDTAVAEDGSVTLDPRTNDATGPANESGQALSVTAVTQGAHGAVTFSSTGVTYTPATNYNGSDSFTYTITDNGTTDGAADHKSDNAAVTVTVTAVNDAPVAVDDNATTAEDAPTTIAVVANDTDVDNTHAELSVVGGSVSDPAHGTATLIPSGGPFAGQISYTPDADYNGPDSFTYTVSDGALGSNVATVSITVTAVNDAPDAVNDAASMGEDSFTTFDPRTNDSTGPNESAQTLTVTSVTHGANGTVTFTGGSVTYSPNADFNGTDSFSYTITDNGTTNGIADHKSDTATVNVTVNEVNDKPIAVNDSTSVAEDGAVSLDPRANDSTGPANESGQTLTVTAVTQGTNGSVTFTATGVTYTPNGDFNGSDTFTYTVTDNGTTNGAADPLSDTATVNVTVTPVNDAPVTSGGSATTAEDTATEITLGASDVDGDTLTYTIVSGPAHGVLSDAGAVRTYTPDADYFGADSFTFKVNDGTVDSNVSTVSIEITAVNDAPVAQGQSVTTAEDTATAITLAASDVDSASLTYEVVAGPSHGTLSGTAPDVTYTPDPNFNGPDSFTFKANDGSLDSNVATVSITVTAVNDAPVAVADATETDEDTATVIDVVANDTDIDNTTAQLSVVVGSVGEPAHGTAALITEGAEAGKVSYTPDADYFGSDSFTYTVSDGDLVSNTATVSITVTAVNDAPVADGQSVTTAEDTAKALTLTGSDIEGSALTYAIVDGPAHGTLSGAAPSLTYTPAANYNGPDSFTFKADDGSLDSNTATVSITVDPVNDAPTVSVTSFTVDPVTREATTTGTYADPDVSDTHTVVFTYKDGTEVILATASKPATGGSVTDKSILPARCYSNLTVTVTVTDGPAGAAGSATGGTSTEQVDVYRASFQAPIKDSERNLAKAGNVVPVKVVLTSSCTGTAVTTQTLYVQVVRGAAPGDVAYGDEVITTSVSSADTGTQMRAAGGGYMYNLSTKTGFTTGQDYTIRIRVGDPTTGAIILTAVLRTYK